LSDEPAWRHARQGVVESRPRRDLILRMIMGAGNYDYLFDWVFQQDGTIRVELAATGIDQVKGAQSRGAGPADAPEDRYGRFVAPYLVAPDHSHFFSFRLDFDVDGQSNSLVVDRLETERQPASNPRRSVWRVNSMEARTESDAKRHSPMTAPELWRVVNPGVRGAYGEPVGYVLDGHGAMTLLTEDDYMRRRSGFTDYTLWATPLSPAELFAAGDYPTGSVAGEGLPQWTAANRPIANTDIVLWYVMGFHHIPRPEDYPILSLERHSFEIKPAGFFARNPAIDLPR
jgi:primary-amine oxidase